MYDEEKIQQAINFGENFFLMVDELYLTVDNKLKGVAVPLKHVVSTEQHTIQFKSLFIGRKSEQGAILLPKKSNLVFHYLLKNLQD